MEKIRVVIADDHPLIREVKHISQEMKPVAVDEHGRYKWNTHCYKGCAG
jgi:hypothetical protein